MNTDLEIFKDGWQALKKQENEKSIDEKLADALDNAWADETYLAEGLVDIADNAYTMTPKWEVYPDYNSRLQALKEIRKIKSNKPEVQVNIANIFWNAWNSL